MTHVNPIETDDASSEFKPSMGHNSPTVEYPTPSMYPGDHVVQPKTDDSPEGMPKHLLLIADKYGLPKVESLLREVAELPECPLEEAPNYFTEDGVLDDTQLPDYLKGLKISITDISITAHEYSHLL